MSLSNVKSLIVGSSLFLTPNFNFTKVLSLNATITDVMLQRGWSITARISNGIQISAVGDEFFCAMFVS